MALWCAPLALLIWIATLVSVFPVCGGKKKSRSRKKQVTPPDEEDGSSADKLDLRSLDQHQEVRQNKPSSPFQQRRNGPQFRFAQPPRRNPTGPRPPAKHAMVDTNDANYQTLRGLDQDNIFGENKAKGFIAAPRAPKEGGMVGTSDPNYQTLAAVNADCFQEKGGSGGNAGGGNQIKAPEIVAGAKKMVETGDPNYQTLMGLDQNIFVEKKGAGGGGGGGGGGAVNIRAPQRGGIVKTADPNYQTLAGIGGDIFGADKKKGGF